MHKIMDDSLVERGADIVINKWVQLKANERLCIVTSTVHMKEAELLQSIAQKVSNSVSIMRTNRSSIQGLRSNRAFLLSES